MLSFLIKRGLGLQPFDTPLYFSVKSAHGWTTDIYRAMQFIKYDDANDFAQLYLLGQPVTVVPSPIGVTADERANLRSARSAGQSSTEDKSL